MSDAAQFDGETGYQAPEVPQIVPVRRSPSIGKLVEALAKAQLAFLPIKKQVENTFYTSDKKKAMYADLAAVIAATQKGLAENGLVVIQSPIIRLDTKEAGVESLLAHSSGEWLSNEIILPATSKAKVYSETGSGFTWGVKFDAQTCGIAITYARRYGYQSIVGVAAEEDDDGNSIGEAAGGSTEAAKAVGKKKEEAIKARVDDQHGNLQGLIKSVAKFKTKDGKNDYRLVNMIQPDNSEVAAICFRNHKYPDESTLFSLLDLIDAKIKETKRPVAALFAITRTDKGITIERPIQLDVLHFDESGFPEIRQEDRQ